MGMMLKTVKPLLIAAVFATASAAQAADLYEPPVVEVPPPEIVYKEVSYGGWYLRGDINYHWSQWRNADYITYGCCGVVDPGVKTFDSGELKGALSLGVGVGYQINRYLRTDLTADYWFNADFTGTTSGTCGGVPCASIDKASYSALVLLANAYADLGTYYGITPYVGAGIGGVRMKWDDLENDIGGVVTKHKGSHNWRFAWALMAGASYCLTDRLALDVGYRFTRIAAGRMFEYANGVGPGRDRGLNVHEARAGVRYQFGGGNAGCQEPEVVAYEPPPYEPPVYK